jgi:nicotinamide-nucleotide amidase
MADTSDVNPVLAAKAREIVALGREAGLMVATAESCTGGLIGAALTSVPGSSWVYDRGIISYSNEAKQKLLMVPAETLEAHGAVSHETAEAMVRGLLEQSDAAIGISVTGVAGPDGGTPGKPVGLVYIGYVRRGGVLGACKCNFAGDRAAVRHQTVLKALDLIEALMKDETPA